MRSLESFLRLFIGVVDGVENVGVGRVTSLTAIAPVPHVLSCSCCSCLYSCYCNALIGILLLL